MGKAKRNGTAALTRRPTVTTLRSLSLLTELPVHSLDKLVELGTWQDFAPGESILRQGEAATMVFFVLAGHIKVVRGGSYLQTVHAEGGADRRVRKRQQVTLALLGPGDLAGEIATLIGTQRSASLVALSPCTVVGIPSQEFVALMNEHGGFALAVAKRLARRLWDTAGQSELARADLESRVRALLRYCAQTGLDAERWLSNTEIAKVVGASRVAVSQLMGSIHATSVNRKQKSSPGG